MSDMFDREPPPDDPPAATPRYEAPPPDAPPQSAGRYGRPAFRRGAGKADAVPRMENVRVTAPDLARRAALEKIAVAAGDRGGWLHRCCSPRCWRSWRWPRSSCRWRRTDRRTAGDRDRRRRAAYPVEATLPGQRAMITDRNGQPMAISLNTVSLFADPRQIGDAGRGGRGKLKKVLPRSIWPKRSTG